MVRMLSLIIVLLVPNLFAEGPDVVPSTAATTAGNRPRLVLPEPDRDSPRRDALIGPPAEASPAVPAGARATPPAPLDTAARPAHAIGR